MVRRESAKLIFAGSIPARTFSFWFILKAAPIKRGRFFVLDSRPIKNTGENVFPRVSNVPLTRCFILLPAELRAK